MKIVNSSITDGEGATGMSVAELVHRHLERLTPGERKIARTLLSHYPLVGLEPLAEFARRTGVSHPTVLRFIAKLGFSGYADFQTALRVELGARLKSPLTKHHADQPRTQHADSEKDFLDEFAAAACENIRMSLTSMPRGEVQAVTDLLADQSNSVYLLGGRFTDAMALYTYMHLRVLRPRVHHVYGPPLSWSEYLLDVNNKCVVVVFDIRRYQDDVITFATQAARRGAHVVLITDQWLSPISSAAEHVLAVRIEVPSRWDSSAAIVTLMESIIAAINNRTWKRLADRIGDLEHLRTHFDKLSWTGQD
ncbi:MAG: MurR/RpiR family transcriptional regulator [Aquisalimonadaceae bacterium]